MAIVRKTIENDLGEVTSVLIMKGSSRELLKRHVNCIVPLMQSGHEATENNITAQNESAEETIHNNTRPKRDAARLAEQNIKLLCDLELA